MKPGFTTIEILVVLILMSLSATIVAVAFRRPATTPDGWRARLVDARHRAIATNTPVTGWMDSVGRFTAKPDGTVLTDSAPQVRFSLAPHAR